MGQKKVHTMGNTKKYFKARNCNFRKMRYTINKKYQGALDGAPFKIITAHDGAEKSAHDG